MMPGRSASFASVESLSKISFSELAGEAVKPSLRTQACGEELDLEYN